MGVGDPLEASATLHGPIDAGTWHLVGDGLILKEVDVRFEVIWRDAAGDHPVVTFDHHFFESVNASPYEADATGAAVPARSGDELVLRMTASGASSGPAYIPNADGALTGGKIPSLTLP